MWGGSNEALGYANFVATNECLNIYSDIYSLADELSLGT
jgi:hypothetical protein